MDITFILVRSFLVWIAIAFVLSAPLAHFTMNIWLRNFTYNTNIFWRFYPLTLAVILLVTWITISFQTIKAALRNPVETLRYE